MNSCSEKAASTAARQVTPPHAPEMALKTEGRALAPAPPCIAILGSFGAGNLGADASLEAVERSVTALRPGSNVIAISAVPRAQYARGPGREIALAWAAPSGVLTLADRASLGALSVLVTFVRAVRVLRDVDALIVPGTHLFDDYGRAHGAPRWALLTWVGLARVSGIPIALVGIGAGPFRSRRDRYAGRLIALWSLMRSFRDKASREHVGALVPDARHDPVYPDLLLALPEPMPVTPRPTEGTGLTVGVDVVSRECWLRAGAGPASYEDYAATLGTFVHWLLDRGLTVRLLKGNAAGDGAIAALAERVMRPRFGQGRERLLAAPAASVHELMQHIAETDIVAASHYHVAAGALKLGKPALSLALTEATAGLLAELGFMDLSQPIEAIDGTRLIDQFTRLVVGRKAYEASVLEVRTDLERRLAEQQARLAEVLR